MSLYKKETISMKDIFVLLQQGETNRGIEQLYNEHYNKIYGIAFSIVKNQSISEDIVHNVIFRLMTIDSSNFPTKYESSWLYTVVKNEALMLLRKEKITLPIEGLPLALEDKSIDDYVDMEGYYSMLKGLNEEQQQIVTLKVLGDYTHREIAEMIGKPVGTVQWIYNTAIKKLRRLLSALLSFTVIAGALLCYRIIDYVNLLYSYPELPDQNRPYIPFDYTIIVFGIAFVLLITATIIIYLKSYILPTKATRKNI